jgi:hypothetical protein
MHLIKIDFENNKVPAFVEPRKGSQQKWVFYGENNDYPQFLTTLFNRSAKHNAICTDKQLYIKGQGWTFDATGIEGEAEAQLRAFIDNPNPYETLNDLLSKTALDELLYGGFYLKGVCDKTGQLAELYHVDYSRVRSNEQNSEFYISDFWVNTDGSYKANLKPDEYETLPAYDPSKKQKVYIFYYKSYRPGLKTYTLPEYIGAVPAIITDAEIANFHRAEIQNGFKGAKFIIFKNGVPSDEEMKKTERQLKAKFTSTDSAGSMVVDFVDDPARTPEVLNLNGDDFDKRYEALNKTIQEEIFVGHKVVSPMLFGVRVEGQLGGRNEMIDAFHLFQNKYISPKQEIQEKIYNIFAPVKGKLQIKKVEPVMPSFNETVLSEILTKDEMREIIGRKPLDISTNVNKDITDSLNSLSPIVANKVLTSLTVNDIRAIVNKPPLAGGDVLPNSAPAPSGFSNSEPKKQNDELDYSVFSKYGEPIENFVSVKTKKFIASRQEFLSKLEEGVLDIIKKTPDVTAEDLVKIFDTDKTKINDALETLTAEGLIKLSDKGISLTNKGDKKKVPDFEELFIRYRYELNPDKAGEPAILPNGRTRDFCRAMISNPRYFSREDIDNISRDLGQLYGIAGYDAFSMRGGWYHDPEKGVNVPYCRHVWKQELVKRAR